MTDLDYDPPKEVHRLGIQAMVLHSEGGQRLDDAAVETLSKGLAALHGDLQELLHALAGLGAAMLHLEQRGDAASAARLKGLIEAQAPVFEPLKQALTEKLQDRAEGAVAQARALLGAPAQPRTAPRHGAPPPQGTTRLSDLMPNPALRPPPRRK
jgi:hypothetical protein